jgi:hypothetical protein
MTMATIGTQRWARLCSKSRVPSNRIDSARGRTAKLSQFPPARQPKNSCSWRPASGSFDAGNGVRLS